MFDVAKYLKVSAVTERKIDLSVLPVFAAFLVGICLFMSVIFFGSGNFFGGIVFGSILVPLYLLASERDARDKDKRG
ncbi:MAG: hypothetical protein O3A84_08730 [Proteobacteria bacterium]|nr:hypothetical protein [Pseudomonadota bacterium]